MIAIMYNDRTYEMEVLELKPADAVTVIECDLNVDFAPPVGYDENAHRAASTSGPGQPTGNGGANGGQSLEHEDEVMDVADMLPEPEGFVAFSGNAVRLDGKKKKTVSESEPVPQKQVRR